MRMHVDRDSQPLLYRSRNRLCEYGIMATALHIHPPDSPACGRRTVSMNTVIYDILEMYCEFAQAKVKSASGYQISENTLGIPGTFHSLKRPTLCEE